MKIGLSSCFFHADPERAIFKGKTLAYAEESMIQYILRNGAKPILLPRLNEDQLVDWVSELDGLVLQGGSDLSPKSYGEEPIKEQWLGDEPRDIYEMQLVKEFLKQKLPIFGICRGIQLINVALGGSLYQDIGEQLENSLVHRDWNIYDTNYHDIEIAKDSWLHSVYKKSQGLVNSVHHQGIKSLGKGLLKKAHSPKDGIIEAIENDGSIDSFVLGVQWHPEFQKENEKDLLNPDLLMKGFLDVCS